MIKLNKWATNRKYRVDTVGISESVQIMLFRLGCNWDGHHGADQPKKNLHSRYLFVGATGSIGWCDDDAYFDAHAFTETEYSSLFDMFLKANYEEQEAHFLAPSEIDIRVII